MILPRPMIVLEMANNHMGDVGHGIALVEAMRDVCREFDFEFGFKLQYRQLDSFVHASYRGRDDIKYVKRFEETRLSHAEFGQLLDAMRRCGFRTVCTPFDEASVDVIEAQGIEVVKVASCSFNDWPLLERIARVERPIIVSTAGAVVEDIDAVVSFLLHRGRELTLMHCVAEYPTPDEHLHLHRIGLLRTRYPGVRIGYSTHEHPERVEPAMLAWSQGARVFEKHVGLATDRYALNDYSAGPEQVRAWLRALTRARTLCGDETWVAPTRNELDSLHSLRRGVFTTRALAAGDMLTADLVEFAFPPVAGQLTANDWSKYARFTARTAIGSGSPVMVADLDVQHTRDSVMRAVKAVRALLQAGNIVVPGKSELEISHHYGMEAFDRFGLTMITVVNREYCKKLIAMLPGQTHPEQLHRKKEETFVVLHGRMTLWLDDVEHNVGPGDVVTVPRGVRHRFHTEEGVVFEEISSTHHAADSFYTDPAITANPQRKTMLSYWMG